MARIDDLQQVRADLIARMETCESDQNFAVMGRLLVEVLSQIDELAGEKSDGKETGLSDFEKRLQERQKRTTKGSGRSKSG